MKGYRHTFRSSLANLAGRWRKEYEEDNLWSRVEVAVAEIDKVLLELGRKYPQVKPSRGIMARREERIKRGRTKAVETLRKKKEFLRKQERDLRRYRRKRRIKYDDFVSVEVTKEQLRKLFREGNPLGKEIADECAAQEKREAVYYEAALEEYEAATLEEDGAGGCGESDTIGLPDGDGREADCSQVDC